jgi:hypothetical protein
VTALMTQAQRELIEEFGLLYEQMGSTRMCGRVGGWLLLCEPPVQSLAESAEGLGVSKAAVSGAARLLLQNNVVERVGEPGQRGDFYRALPVDPEDLIPLDQVHRMHNLLTRALASVADRDQAQSNYALMHDLLELTVFIEAELPQLIERWRDHLASRAACPVATDAQTDTGGTL